MKRQFILALLCLITALAAYNFTPSQRLADRWLVNLEQMIPPEFGEWQMEQAQQTLVVSAEQTVFIQSIYSQVLSRSYVNRYGDRIMLSIAYTQDQSDNTGKQSHRPEICYPAQGFVIRDNRHSTLHSPMGSIKLNQLIAVQGERVEPISYWTMIGSKAVNSVIETKLAQIGYGLHGMIADGLIFRVSTLGSDPAIEYAKQEQFINQLITSLSGSDRQRIAGLGSVD